MKSHQYQSASICFPSIAVTLGGVQRISYTAKGYHADIVTADGREVRVKKSMLPPFEKWTAFNLADAAAAHERGVIAAEKAYAKGAR